MLPRPSPKALVHNFPKCSKDTGVDVALFVHSHLRRYGFQTHYSLGHYLVCMLARVGHMYDANEAFDGLKNSREDSLTALIQGYCKCGKAWHCLMLYRRVQRDSPHLDASTFLLLLKACTQLKDAEGGREIHAEVARNGLLKADPFIGSALVDMHAKCGSLVEAKETFDILLVKDVVTWTAMIGGYADRGYGLEALRSFHQMELSGVLPNAVTYVCCLKACGAIGAISKGIEIHYLLERKGLLKSSTLLSNSLIDMYGKCGMLERAQKVFDKLTNRDVVSWTALVGGYTQHGLCEESLNCFERMQRNHVSPNALTFSSILKACGSLGAIDKGREVHAMIMSEGLLSTNLFVGNALVDMYAKCGMLSKAQEIFHKLPVHDLVSWNALVTGYALLAEIENVFLIFERMKKEGSRPDIVTFVSMLNACSHAGLVELGQTCYVLMCVDHGIAPTLEHCTCMIDLLSRTGQLEKAVVMMKRTAFHPNIVLWLTILGACWKWANVELGREAFEEILRLDEKEDSAYVCMYNIYACAGMVDEAKEIDAMRERNETRKMLMVQHLLD